MVEFVDTPSLYWRWVTTGLRGRHYQLCDLAGEELGSVRVTTITGSLRRVSTTSAEYHCFRRPWSPFTIVVRDAVTRSEVAAVRTSGRAARIDLAGAPPLQAIVNPDGQAQALRLITVEGLAAVNVRFLPPYQHRSFHRPYPSGEATVLAIEPATDGILIAALALFLRMVMSYPNV